MLFKNMLTSLLSSLFLFSATAQAAKFKDHESMLKTFKVEAPQGKGDDDFSENPIGFLLKNHFIPAVIKNADKELTSSELGSELTAILNEVLRGVQEQAPELEESASFRLHLSAIFGNLFCAVANVFDSEADANAVYEALEAFISSSL